MISPTPQFSDPKHEFWSLMEGLCEDRLSAEQMSELENYILSDPAARRLYRDYIDLHGSLYWDAALANRPVAAPAESIPQQAIKKPAKKYSVLALACLLLIAVGFWFLRGEGTGKTSPGLAENEMPKAEDADDVPAPEQGNPPPTPAVPERNLLDDSPWPAIAERRPSLKALPKRGKIENPAEDKIPQPPTVAVHHGSADEIVAAIDAEILQSWDDAQVEASPVASDAEWVRRVHLDLIGQIPPADRVEEFLKDRRADKRAILINELLDDPAYVRHFATVWTNLLVGRSAERDVDRVAVHRFLRESFGRNRPWSDVVKDLVSAEGTVEENGASGFLLAHLNNQAVPATAITARIFLCTQVQCTQCHKHPNSDALQNEFWELNSFFKQTAIESRRVKTPNGKTRVARALVSKREGGATLYEDLSGAMHAAFPKFAGVEISPGANVNRRRELAELITAGENPQAAKAMVNRMWAHFFGYGFTRPLEDMGPHNPPSHPDLLDRLAREFVKSGFDVKQLIRWICLSKPYQLSSRFTAQNEIDNPSTGETPLFSKMYVRSMTVEQLYDSLLVASKAHFAAGSSWQDIQEQRQAWLQQFVTAFDTEENDEETLFEGTVPQALLLMNSELVEQAVRPKQGTFFSEVLRSPAGEAEKIRRLCLAALSRYPTPSEMSAARRMIAARRNAGGSKAAAEALQDIFWAFLNSNEFILVH